MIIALEGIDASGKQTQAKVLKEALQDHFSDIRIHDFPHYETIAGGVVGRVIRGETIVLSQEDAYRGLDLKDQRSVWSNDKALIIQALMVADRLEWQHLLREYDNHSDKLLILDRYLISGLVYGQADGLDPQWLCRIQQSLIEPEAHFLLDISVEESFKRRPERRDYYEKNKDKLTAVRKIYKAEFRDPDPRLIRKAQMFGIKGDQDLVDITLEISEQILDMKG